jgi:hypothetical protein
MRLGKGKKIYRCMLILRGCLKAQELTEIIPSELGISASPAGDLEDFRIFEISDFNECLTCIYEHASPAAIYIFGNMNKHVKMSSHSSRLTILCRIGRDRAW